MQLSLHGLLVFAPDLAEAARFYGDVLGLRLVERAEAHLSFEGDGFALLVFACEESTEVGRYSAAAGSSIAFAVASLDASVAELSAKGVRFLHETPNEGPSGRYVAFTDPFGTVHELIEPR